jgi:hypothetical protein
LLVVRVMNMRRSFRTRGGVDWFPGFFPGLVCGAPLGHSPEMV